MLSPMSYTHPTAVGLSLNANERGGSDERSTNSTNLSPSNTNEVFIKSFIFQPDLPIRIDYEAKGFKTEMVPRIQSNVLVCAHTVSFVGHSCWYHAGS